MIFKHKIGLNLANTRDRPTNPAPRSSNLMVLLKYTSNNPCCHGNENLGILTHNSANITHRAMNVAPNIFEVKQFAGVIGIYIRPTAVSMATKM